MLLQALGALLNMTVTEALREDVGKKGAVQVTISKFVGEGEGEEGSLL